VVDFGSLPNATSKDVPHDIEFTSDAQLTRVYGAATDPETLNFIPLPFSSPTLSNNVSVEIDGTNVTITTGSDRTNFIITSVIIEYTKES
jgi:hypothetical protein